MQIQLDMLKNVYILALIHGNLDPGGRKYCKGAGLVST